MHSYDRLGISAQQNQQKPRKKRNTPTSEWIQQEDKRQLKNFAKEPIKVPEG